MKLALNISIGNGGTNMNDQIKTLRAIMKIKRALKLIKEAAVDLSDDDKECAEEFAEIEEMLKSLGVGND
jgi:histidyl-tRNA synthetase